MGDAKRAWEEDWHVVQMARVAHFGEHGGQWWVYSGESPIMGYQGPPIPEEHARLAAAAPELYRALEAIVDAVDDNGHYYLVGTDRQDVKRLLAKARGGS